MAEFVQLVVKVDKSQLSNLQQEVKQLGGQTIKMNVDASGVEAARSAILQTAQTVNAKTKEIIKETEKAVLGAGKYVTTIKAGDKETKVYTADIEKQEKATSRLETRFQMVANAIAGIGKAYKSAADSAAAFNDYGETKVEKALGSLPNMSYTAAQWQNFFNAQNNVSNGFKSAADSAAVFQMQGLTPLEKQLRNTEKATDDVTGASESLISNIAKFTKWYLIGNAISGIVRSLKEAVETIKAVDDELVTVRKVTDFSAAQMKMVEEQAYKTASAYGIAADAYLESVSAFARAGYKEQSTALAELATKTQIVGDTTAETAQQFLLSVDAAYKMNGSVTELSKVLDGANEIDNKYATSIEKIAEGLGSVAPVASQMHVSVAELTAAIGTITAVTQRSGNEAAKALRALFLNIVGDTKTEIEEGVTWTTGEIAGLRDVIKTYAPEAYKAAQATGSIIDPMEAIGGLAKSMKDGLLTEQELMSMVSDIGGKLRSSQLLALIQNWDMYQSMLVDYGNALGSADKEVSNALNSWTRKTEQLKNAWAELISNIVDSSDVKTALDILTKFVNLMNDRVAGPKVEYNGTFGEKQSDAIHKNALAYQQLAQSIEEINSKENKSWFDEWQLSGYQKRLTELEKELRKNITAYHDYSDAGGEAAEADVILISALEDMLGIRRENTLVIEEETEKTEESTQSIEDAAGASKSAQIAIDELEKSCKAVSAALKDYSDYGGLTTDAMDNLDAAIPDVVGALFNEEGALTDAGKAAFETAQKLDGNAEATKYLQQQADLFSLQNTITQLGVEGIAWDENTQKIKANLAARIAALPTKQITYDGITSTVVADMDEYNRLMSAIGQINQYESSWSGYEPKYSAPKSSGSSSSSSKTATAKETDEQREALERVVKLRKEELEYLKAHNAESDDQIAKLKEIQDAEHKVNEYLRSKPEYAEAQRKLEEDVNSLTKEEVELLSAVLDNSKAWMEQQKEINELIGDGLEDIRQQIKAQQELVSIDEKVLKLYDLQGASAAEKNRIIDQIVDELILELELTKELEDSYDRQLELAILIQQYRNQQAENTRKEQEEQQKAAEDAKKEAEKAKEDAQKERLNAYKEAVTVQEQILTLMQSQNASDVDQLNQIRRIQQALRDELNYLQQINASESDRLAIQVKIQQREAEIAKLIKEAEGNTKTAFDAYVDAIIESLQRQYEESIKPLQEQLDMLEAQRKAVTDQRNEQEKLLAVEKARIALQNAQKERTVRQYNADSGQWEWVSDPRNVQSATQALLEAVKDLADFKAEQLYDKQKSAIEDLMKTAKGIYDDVGNAWKELAEKVKEGSITVEEALATGEQSTANIIQTATKDKLEPAIQSVVDAFTNGATGEDGLSDAIADIVKVIKSGALDENGVEAAIATLVQVIASGALGENSVQSAIQSIVDVLGNGGEETIPGAIDTLVQALTDASAKDGKIPSAIKALVDSLLGGVDEATGIPYGIQAVIKAFEDGTTGENGITSALSGIAGSITEITATINGKSGDVATALSNLIEALNALNDIKSASQNTVVSTPVITYTTDNAPTSDTGTSDTTNTDSGEWLDAWGNPNQIKSNVYYHSEPIVERDQNLAGKTVKDGDYVIDFDKYGYPVGVVYLKSPAGKSYLERNGVDVDSLPQEKVVTGTKKVSYVYDSGGLLRGIGGIKATNEDEMVLPPDITKAVLSPALTRNVAGQLDKLGVITGARKLGATSLNFAGGNSIGTQNNGDTFIIDGIDVSEHINRGTTIGELARYSRTLPQAYNS